MLGKKSFNFLVADLFAPKSGDRLEKQPVLGLTHGFFTSFLGATHSSIRSWKYVI